MSKNNTDPQEELLELTKRLKNWDSANDNSLAPLEKKDLDSYFSLDQRCNERFLKVQNDKVDPPQHILNVLDKEQEDINYNPSDLLKFYKLNSQQCLALQEQKIIPFSNLLKTLVKHAEILSTDYSKINETILSIHKECEVIRNDQEKHQKLLNTINCTLRIFERIDNIQEKLGDSPSLPLSYDNCIMLFDHIYENIKFLREKPRYKDTPIYLAKCWNQAHKILDIIKTKIFKIINEAFVSIEGQQLQQKTVYDNTANCDDMFVRFYAKFRAGITEKSKHFIQYLEKRKRESLFSDQDALKNGLSTGTNSSEIHPLVNKLNIDKEIDTILDECKLHYLNKREKTLFPIVRNTLEDLLKKHSNDHCNLVRHACSFFSNLYNDETNMYHHVFAIASKDFNKFLDRLCNIMYDSLRTRIVKVKHLETLSELCSVLRDELNYNTEEAPPANEFRLPSHTYSETDTFDNGYEKDSAFELASTQIFNETIERLMGDVRERLVFITHLYVESDILKYAPSPGDIAYPDKLKMIKDISESLKSNHPNLRGRTFSTISSGVNRRPIHLFDEESGMSDTESITSSPSTLTNTDHSTELTLTNDAPSSRRTSSVYSGYSSRYTSSTSRFSNSPYELYGLWYPTVRRTIVCLSKLNRCLDKTVFQSLSQDVLDACLKSLHFASNLIQDKTTLVDSQLFTVKHLLILREQISPFNTRFSQKEVILDFPNVKDMAIKMVQHKKALLSFSKNNAFLEFIVNSAPGYHEQYLDSKKIVDDQLRVLCQLFIKDSSYLLTGQIINFLQEKFQMVDKLRFVDPNLEAHDPSEVPSIEDGKNDQITHVSNHLTNGNITVDSIENINHKLPMAKDVAQFVTSSYKAFKENTKFLKTRLSLYLANSDTEYILFRPLKINAQKCFCKLRDIILQYYTEEEQSIIGYPSFEQVSLVLSSEYDN